ncbi:MAG: hypothetical protein BWY63_02854 [Chloroflexi bacterium ADurb.Bin360]|nr:MAG: hypothetical protein BWY63_02854 [Chloroflexi bacterium ADurb.Bin360]
MHPLGTIPASFFFGGLLVGANKLQRAVQVPAALIVTLNGLVVVFVVGTELWRQQRARRRVVERVAEHDEPSLTAPPPTTASLEGNA